MVYHLKYSSDTPISSSLSGTAIDDVFANAVATWKRISGADSRKPIAIDLEQSFNGPLETKDLSDTSKSKLEIASAMANELGLRIGIATVEQELTSPCHRWSSVRHSAGLVAGSKSPAIYRMLRLWTLTGRMVVRNTVILPDADVSTTLRGAFKSAHGSQGYSSVSTKSLHHYCY